MLRALVYVGAFFIGIGSALSDPLPSDDIAGFWYTQDRDGIVEIYRCEHKFCGRFQWVQHNGSQDIPRDEHNPDPSKRDKLLCGLDFMGGFVPDDKHHYADGWIYSPRDGQTYSASMTLADHNTLNLHGYILHPLLGASQVWTRTDSSLSCERG